MGLPQFGEMKKSNAETYLDYLSHMFGEPYVIRKMEAADKGSPVHVFFYQDLPEEGMLTSITYGLSEGNHPDWKNDRCEIILSLNTDDESWGLATAFFAAQYRGKMSFQYGSLFTLDEPISKESEMCGFLTFAPSFLEPHQSTFYMPGYKIFLCGMYPIYKEEISVYNEIGFERFWHSDNFDMYDINRERVTLE